MPLLGGFEGDGAAIGTGATAAGSVTGRAGRPVGVALLFAAGFAALGRTGGSLAAGGKGDAVLFLGTGRVTIGREGVVGASGAMLVRLAGTSTAG